MARIFCLAARNAVRLPILLSREDADMRDLEILSPAGDMAA